MKMKIKDRYHVINQAIKQYNETFQWVDFKLRKFSKKELFNLLESHTCSSGCMWFYCCDGIWQNCWQDPFFEGNWGCSQKDVDDTIRGIIEDTAKACKKDNRIGWCENEDGVHIVIIARDLLKEKADYFITFTDKQLW